MKDLSESKTHLSTESSLGEPEIENDVGQNIETLKKISVGQEDEMSFHKNTVGKFSGIFYGLLAALCFSCAAFTSKLLSKKHYHTFNITLWKYQGMTLFAPFFLLYFRFVRKDKILDTISPMNRKSLTNIAFLIIRSTFGVCTMALVTQSLQYLTLAYSSVIAYSTPIAVGLFARIFLGEACKIMTTILALFTFMGVCVLARPPILTGTESFDITTLIGIAYAFSSMLFLSSVLIIIRHLREVHFSIMIMFYGYIGTLECSILAFCFGVIDIPKCSVDLLIAAGNAVLTFAGEISLTFALQAELAGLVSLVRTVDVVFAFIWQTFIGDYPDLYSLIGAGIVISAIIVSGFIKWLSTVPVENPIRRRLWFLLK